MEGEGNISDYRSRLDKTLSSPDLTNYETLRTLLKNQILQSSLSHFEESIDNVVERRSKEMCNLLKMLRSTSINDVDGSAYSKEAHGGWKLKQDTDELRVMYREGPEGTPFHTLLAEGFVDGPLDVCMCLSWESTLYAKWWPQTLIPTFRVLSSQCLQRLRTGEQIALVRMKVSWPLSSREVVLHYFSFEFFQDDLMVVLLNSISDSEIVDRSTHGFTREGIPDAEEVVRIDVVGGFALQKVTANRSYFRTIANMDIKIDFVPPAFINFLSRQLIGSGFKLYKKEIASVSKGDDKFHEALMDPFYVRIREALYSGNATESKDPINMQEITSVIVEDQSGEAVEDDNAKKKNPDDSITDSQNKTNEIEEIEEDDTKESESLDNGTKSNKQPGISNEGRRAALITIGVTETNGTGIKKKVRISPEVERALKTLEKVISTFREHNIIPEKDIKKINEAVEESVSSEADQMSRTNLNCAEASKPGSQESNSVEARISSASHASRHKGSNSYTRETSQSKIVPSASPDDQDRSSPSNSADANSINGNSLTKTKKKRSRFCCSYFISQY